MKRHIAAFITLLALTCGFASAHKEVPLDGKKIELIASCGHSKVPNAVFVTLAKKKYRVELTEKFAMKFKAGDKCWIGLTGIVRDMPFGQPGLTAEHADGFIEVIEIEFLDQKPDRKRALKVLD